MAQLFYLPKNAKDPKNHPRRLYFSCHPDDCGLMEEIYGDIQKFCEDFVLFYPDLSQRPVQWDHLDEVANAQLLVMPVTKKLLTDENDIVVDIFGGSNTTGRTAEELNRRWYSFELSKEYVAASVFRFSSAAEEAKTYYDAIMQDNFIEL